MKKNIVRDLLPTCPVDIEIDHWWLVNVGYVSEEDIKVMRFHLFFWLNQNCTEGEHMVIDMLIDNIDKGPIEAGKLDKSIVKSLYKKGLIYLDVPIHNDDYISGLLRLTAIE